jgi:hypothetical protein
MKTSKSHIEEMQAKLSEISNRELLLIAALGEALSLADKKLLDEVRSLTIEHETRRGLILSELQSLAARIGAFPAMADCQDFIKEREHLDLPYYETSEATAEEETSELFEPVENPGRGGDWRQATMNIRDELGFHLNGRKVTVG